MKNINKIQKRLLLIAAGASLLSMTLQADPFPWWYNKLLGWYMPTWLLQILQQPELFIAITGVFLLIKFITFSYLSYKLIQKRRALKELQARYDKLEKSHETMQAAHIHHQTMIAHLTTLLAHQQVTMHRPGPLPPPPETTAVAKKTPSLPLSDAE